MLNQGAIEEVAALGNASITCEKAIGIAQISSYLSGELTRPECAERIAAATRQYAKRQRTWFSKEAWLTPCPVSEHTDMVTLASDLIQE